TYMCDECYERITEKTTARLASREEKDLNDI
ncbi:DUF2197 domain-containing protein, partial [Heyndrickxia sporothermodurans]